MPHRDSARGARPIAWAFALLCGLLAILPLAGCATQAPAGAAQAEPTPTSAQTALPAVTTQPTAQVTTDATAAATIAAVPPVTSTQTLTATPAGTPTPRPTPTGPPIEEPLLYFSPFDFVLPGSMVAKSDVLQLDGEGTEEALITITEGRLGATKPLTEEVTSALGVVTYDTVYREWAMLWQSDLLPGTARPLLDIEQPGGYNGGDLLRDGSAILALRTTTLDGKAHLFVFRYDRQARAAAPLKVITAPGGAEEDAHFEADLDATMADLDDDGVYEVIVDNVAGVQTWRWDGSRFVPREAR